MFPKLFLLFALVSNTVANQKCWTNIGEQKPNKTLCPQTSEWCQMRISPNHDIQERSCDIGGLCDHWPPSSDDAGDGRVRCLSSSPSFHIYCCRRRLCNHYRTTSPPCPTADTTPTPLGESTTTEQPFPWWIVAAVVGGVALLVAAIIGTFLIVRHCKIRERQIIAKDKSSHNEKKKHRQQHERPSRTSKKQRERRSPFSNSSQEKASPKANPMAVFITNDDDPKNTGHVVGDSERSADYTALLPDYTVLTAPTDEGEPYLVGAP